MPYTLDDYLDDLVQADRLYLANWVIPYSAAYVEAHRSYKRTLDDQRKYDQMIADIALMAMTIGVGAGMASIYAKAGVTTARQLVWNRALHVVCERNMERIFEVMYRAANSPAAGYIAGQVWDQISSKLGAATKTRVQSLLNPSPLQSEVIADPLVARDRLRRYCVLATAAAHDMATDLKRSDISDDEKNAHARQLRDAPLIQEMPATSSLPRHASKMMELNMYMALILSEDEAVTSRGGAVWGGSTVRETREPVAALPSDDNYPRPYNRNSFQRNGFASSASIDTRVIQFRLGHRIWGRINALSQEIFQRPFYRITSTNAGIGTYTEVVAAENMSRDLQRLTYPSIARDAR